MQKAFLRFCCFYLRLIFSILLSFSYPYLLLILPIFSCFSFFSVSSFSFYSIILSIILFWGKVSLYFCHFSPFSFLEFYCLSGWYLPRLEVYFVFRSMAWSGFWFYAKIIHVFYIYVRVGARIDTFFGIWVLSIKGCKVSFFRYLLLANSLLKNFSRNI